MRTDSLDVVRSDVNAAIDRLLNGSPSHSKLIESALAGKLKINVSTVALESGRSRTYFGYKNCLLPEERRRILELQTSPAQLVAHKELIRNLRAQIAELERSIKVKDTALAAMIVASAQHGLAGKELSDEVLDFRRHKNNKGKSKSGV